MPAQRLRAMSCGANCAPSVAKNPTNSTQHDAVWASTAPRAYAPPCHTHCCGPRQILCIWLAQNTQRAKADAAAHFKRPHKKSVNKRQKTARKTTQAVGMHGECSETAGAWPYYLHRLRPAALWQFRTDATTDTVPRTAIGLLPAPF